MKQVKFSALVLGGWMAVFCQISLAQTDASNMPTHSVSASSTHSGAQLSTPLHIPHRLEIGQATERLFAMQRSPVNPKPRPIDGDQAARSYERYLKSFEREIPEAFETGMNAKK